MSRHPGNRRPTNSKLPWTPLEIDQLRVMADEQIPVSVIARVLHRTVSGVRKCAIKYGIRLPLQRQPPK